MNPSTLSLQLLIAITSTDLVRIPSENKNGVVSTCDKDNKYAPCACKVVITNTKILQHNKNVTVEFPEFPCIVTENERRMVKGKIANGYICTQLRSDKKLYRDINDNPIEISIVYKAGCELRCLDENCERDGNGKEEEREKRVCVRHVTW